MGEIVMHAFNCRIHAGGGDGVFIARAPLRYVFHSAG